MLNRPLNTAALEVQDTLIDISAHTGHDKGGGGITTGKEMQLPTRWDAILLVYSWNKPAIVFWMKVLVRVAIEAPFALR